MSDYDIIRHIVFRRFSVLTGKTHLAVGTASALCMTYPSDFKELALCIIVSSVGSVVCDVDVKSSDSRRDLNRITAITVILGIAVLFAEYKFDLGITKNFSRESDMFRLVLGFISFIAVCTFGKYQPHRSFMHSIPALAILTGIVYFMYPALAPYFFIAMFSHIFIDLFNKKKVKLIYPLKKGFCFKLCPADGKANDVLFLIGSALSVFFLILAILHIFRWF